MLLLACGAKEARSQSGLLIQKNDRPGRVVNIKFKRNYAIRTLDHADFRGRITAHTDLDLQLLPHGFDPVPTTIPLASITEVERGNFYQGAGGICLVSAKFCLIGAPIAWATEGGDRALYYLAGAGLGLALAIPFLLLSERFRYDLVHTWHWRVITPAEPR